MAPPLITVITPTTGKASLHRLVDSLGAQSVPHVHLMLWDDKREGEFDKTSSSPRTPFDLESDGPIRFGNAIVLKGTVVQGQAFGSALRAVGLMASCTEFVTFADDDVWFDKDHLAAMLEAIRGKEWCYTVRRIYDERLALIGEDRFESVGDEAKTPYEMVDNSSMMMARKFASHGAALYRETTEYNDDRLMYAFLKKVAGPPGKTRRATVNQVCPKRLEDFFRANCSR